MLIFDYYYCRLFFTKHVITSPSNVQNYFTGSLKILIQLECKSGQVGEFHVCKDLDNFLFMVIR